MTTLSDEVRRRLAAEIAAAAGREVSFVAEVDGEGTVAAVRPVARGTADAVLALPGEASRGEMVLHNHPSGVLEPSQADLSVAAKCYENGIGFGIVNTVLMSVLHRHREFGVLQALGLTPGQTGTIVLVEGLTLTAVSGFIGVSVGLLATWYFIGDGLDMSALMGEDMTFSGVVIDPVMVPQFRLVRIAQILTFILCIGAVASIYPALRAAKIDVAESMKFER